jgi:hypothetical protein
MYSEMEIKLCFIKRGLEVLIGVWLWLLNKRESCDRVERGTGKGEVWWFDERGLEELDEESSMIIRW